MGYHNYMSYIPAPCYDGQEYHHSATLAGRRRDGEACVQASAGSLVLSKQGKKSHGPTFYICNTSPACTQAKKQPKSV